MTLVPGCQSFALASSGFRAVPPSPGGGTNPPREEVAGVTGLPLAYESQKICKNM